MNLASAEDLAKIKNQETLGLCGAIYKRKFEVDSEKQQLERSLHYYTRGYLEGVVNDQGYTGINAAFVLDLLADLEDREATLAGSQSQSAVQRRADARRIRDDIVTRVSPLKAQTWLQGKWWFYSTIAEALFGLGRYDDAVTWLEEGQKKVPGTPEWERQSTLQQLGRLALLQIGERPVDELAHHDAAKALERFFGHGTAVARTAFMGKVGLALSGGGFRAAFYHIGVLAKLAELDVLRHVEVLSCVSGGSIIGAHYYLEMRRLLRSEDDGAITQDHYLNLVHRIEKDFLDGVQRNIRMRVLAGFWTNVRMILGGYSRTVRVGELYEREIFSRVKDDEGRRARWLGALDVVPKNEPETFAPKVDNWRRQAKVPVLILNATSLNTGHNWQFTTSWMGEPPGRIDTSVDGNEQLRRMYYGQAPLRYQQIRLGQATAASSCVPGIFEPLALEKLYPGRVVRLVDGGVCDNQGVSGLLEQDCRVILVSDGSGQSETQPDPSDNMVGVPLRTNTILQARVRDAQFQELNARRRAGLLRALMLVHLKQDLDVDPVDWAECPDPFDASDEARPPRRRGKRTAYGIARDVQALLAGIRTDLDSFSDLEAMALMASGYRMTGSAFECSPGLQALPQRAQTFAWDFLKVEKGLASSGPQHDYLTQILGVSGSIAFKVWKLSRPLKASAVIVGLMLAAALLWIAITRLDFVVIGQITVATVVTVVATTVLARLVQRLVGRRVMALARWRDTLSRVTRGVAMSLAGWIVARLHLCVFDRLFLWYGRIEKLE